MNGTAPALEAARALLPAWWALVPWLFGPAYAALAFATTTFALGPPAVRAPGEHWAEYARKTFGPRTLTLAAFASTAMGGALAAAALSSNWLVPTPLIVLPTMLLPLLGVTHATAVAEASLLGLTLRTAWRSQLALAASQRAVLWLLPLVAVARLSAHTPVAQAAVWVCSVAAVVLAGSGFGLTVGQWLGVSRPARESLRRAVAEASQGAGRSPRRVWELDWAAVNALAYPLLGDIAFTTRAVELLSPTEQRAVAAHELGHLHEPRTVQLSRLAAAPVVVVALLLLFEIPRWGGGPVALAVCLPLVGVVLLLRRVARRGEQAADAHAHHRVDTQEYARALERTYELNLVPAVLRSKGAHGHLYDRLLEAGVEPSWPRPEPPPSPRLARMALSAVLLSPVWLGFFVLLRPSNDVASAQLETVVMGRSGWSLIRFARDARQAGRLEAAGTLFNAAIELEPNNTVLHLARAFGLAQLGRCGEAAAALAATPSLESESSPYVVSTRERVSRCVEGQPDRGDDDE